MKFPNRLREAGHASSWFDTTVACLRDQGLVLQEGTLVDATILEASKGPPESAPQAGRGLSHTKDPSASFTKKHGRTYHGYKAHIATDTQGIITGYVFDTAKVHDSKHMDPLIEGGSKAVYVDSAYMDKQRKARLEGDGVFCGVMSVGCVARPSSRTSRSITTGSVRRSERSWSPRLRG